MRWTFDQSLEKIFPGVKEIQSGHEIQGSNPWPWTVTLTLSWHSWVINSAHGFTKVNIWPKFRENPSTGIGDTEQTWNSRHKPVTLNCDLDLVSAWLSYKFCTSSHWGKHMTLTLSWHSWVINSAHGFTKVNIRPKFKENPSTGIGDTERTWNSRHKPVTLNCDLDLVSAWLSYKFCTSSHWDKHMTKD